MNYGKKQAKTNREKVSFSQTMDSPVIRDGAKGGRIIFAGLFALFCLSTTAFGVGSISGNVSDTGGNPLANIMLWLYQGNDPQVADENAWHWVATAHTDSSGNYQLDNLEARYYRIYVTAQYVGGTYYGKADVHNVPVVDFQNTVRDITLQEAGSISGYVLRHSDSSPLAGVEVQALEGEDENVADWRAWGWAGSATTDSTGFYRINGLRQRRYHVHVNDQDIGGTHYVEADLYNVQVFSGVDTPNMNLRMREAAMIEGHITTSTGIPIPNAWVISNASWTHYAWGWHDAWTDHNGRYELWVLPSPGAFYPVWVRNARLCGTTY